MPETPKTYVWLFSGAAIQCLICNRISYHPMDVKEKYCGNCHRFHDDQPKKGKPNEPDNN